MPTRKRPVQKTRQPVPELSIHPQRGRLVVTLVLSLVVFAAIGETMVVIFQSPNDIGTDVLFAILYLACTVYLLGLAWSALRLLTDRQPSLQANSEGLILRHLPFLGNFSLTWSEIKSIHVARSLFLTHLCIVPDDTQQLLRRRNLLLFALNSSTRLGMRTHAPLSISQSTLDMPIKTLIERIEQDYGVKQTV